VRRRPAAPEAASEVARELGRITLDEALALTALVA
jgi:hypothetical protein